MLIDHKEVYRLRRHVSLLREANEVLAHELARLRAELATRPPAPTYALDGRVIVRLD